MSVVISTRNLTKVYRDGFWKTKKVCALDGLNLEVSDNEILGYLGPNGAGKSTTLKLFTSLIFPSAGEVEILGQPVHTAATRHLIGFLPENPYFYDYLTAEEFLSYYAGLFDLPRATIKSRVSHFLELTGILHARKLQLRKFSKGMLQRVGIAQTLINDPKIVFLDEPMSGLDPIGRRQVRDLILNLKKEGKTVFFSSHILNDVESLCDRVAVLNRGRLVGSGRLSDLISQEVRHLEIIATGVHLDSLRQRISQSIPISQSGSTLRLEVEAQASIFPLVAEIEQAGGRIVSVSRVRESMEDYFLRLVGKVNGPGQGPQEAGRHQRGVSVSSP